MISGRVKPICPSQFVDLERERERERHFVKVKSFASLNLEDVTGGI